MSSERDNIDLAGNEGRKSGIPYVRSMPDELRNKVIAHLEEMRKGAKIMRISRMVRRLDSIVQFLNAHPGFATFNRTAQPLYNALASILAEYE